MEPTAAWQLEIRKRTEGTIRFGTTDQGDEKRSPEGQPGEVMPRFRAQTKASFGPVI
jgi:hypothetical protein